MRHWWMRGASDPSRSRSFDSLNSGVPFFLNISIARWLSRIEYVMCIKVFLICLNTWRSSEPMSVYVGRTYVRGWIFCRRIRTEEESKMQIPFINLFQSFCYFTWNDFVSRCARACVCVGCHRKTIMGALECRLEFGVCFSHSIVVGRLCRREILSFVIWLYRFLSKPNSTFKSFSICDWLPRTLFIYFHLCFVFYFAVLVADAIVAAANRSKRICFVSCVLFVQFGLDGEPMKIFQMRNDHVARLIVFVWFVWRCECSCSFSIFFSLSQTLI